MITICRGGFLKTTRCRFKPYKLWISPATIFRGESLRTSCSICNTLFQRKHAFSNLQNRMLWYEFVHVCQIVISILHILVARYSKIKKFTFKFCNSDIVWLVTTDDSVWYEQLCDNTFQPDDFVLNDDTAEICLSTTSVAASQTWMETYLLMLHSCKSPRIQMKLWL